MRSGAGFVPAHGGGPAETGVGEDGLHVLVAGGQADDRGFNDLASVRLPTSSYFDEEQTHIAALSNRVVERAQQQGTLRADVTQEDLVFVVWSHSRIIHATHGIAPNAWRRHLHLMLDGFRADRSHSLPEPPLTRDQLYRAMLRLGGADVCGA